METSRLVTDPSDNVSMASSYANLTNFSNYSNLSNDFYSVSPASRSMISCISDFDINSVREFGKSSSSNLHLDSNIHSTFNTSDNSTNKINSNTNLNSNPKCSSPHLVMPLVKLPPRRSFTERGKRLSKLKIVVAGASNTGKSLLLQTLFNFSPDIVHVDDVPQYASHNITEIFASTKSYPAWWSDDSDAAPTSSFFHRSSYSEDAVLERNVIGVDTIGFSPSDPDALQEAISSISNYLESQFRKTAKLLAHSYSDSSSLLPIISSPGHTHADLCLYLLDDPLTDADAEYIKKLIAYVPVMILISKSDLRSNSQIIDLRQKILSQLMHYNINPFLFGFHVEDFINKKNYLTNPDKVSNDNNNNNNNNNSQDNNKNSELSISNDTEMPFAVSSMINLNSELEMDASILMASSYAPESPVLCPSQLNILIDRIFNEDFAAWLRHITAKRLISWRLNSTYSTCLSSKFISSPNLSDPNFKHFYRESDTKNIVFNKSYYENNSAEFREEMKNLNCTNFTNQNNRQIVKQKSGEILKSEGIEASYYANTINEAKVGIDLEYNTFKNNDNLKFTVPAWAINNTKDNLNFNKNSVKNWPGYDKSNEEEIIMQVKMAQWVKQLEQSIRQEKRLKRRRSSAEDELYYLSLSNNQLIEKYGFDKLEGYDHALENSNKNSKDLNDNTIKNLIQHRHFQERFGILVQKLLHEEGLESIGPEFIDYMLTMENEEEGEDKKTEKDNEEKDMIMNKIRMIRRKIIDIMNNEKIENPLGLGEQDEKDEFLPCNIERSLYWKPEDGEANLTAILTPRPSYGPTPALATSAIHCRDPFNLDGVSSLLAYFGWKMINLVVRIGFFTSCLGILAFSTHGVKEALVGLGGGWSTII